MANQTNGNQFRDEEILVLDQLRDGKWVKNIFPKIGGRLRLAHEANEQLSISTEIIKYDENLAVVKAVTSTIKGSFPGIGMSSVERDHSIAPAILELAETRAIARSLRFAGYGVEYCSAEEVSHLQNGGDNPPPDEKPQTKPPQEGPKGGDADKPGSGGNGGDKGGGNGGNGGPSSLFLFSAQHVPALPDEIWPHLRLGNPTRNQAHCTSFREGNPQRRRSLLPVAHGDGRDHPSGSGHRDLQNPL